MPRVGREGAPLREPPGLAVAVACQEQGLPLAAWPNSPLPGDHWRCLSDGHVGAARGGSSCRSPTTYNRNQEGWSAADRKKKDLNFKRFLTNENQTRAKATFSHH